MKNLTKMTFAALALSMASSAMASEYFETTRTCQRRRTSEARRCAIRNGEYSIIEKCANKGYSRAYCRANFIDVESIECNGARNPARCTARVSIFLK